MASLPIVPPWLLVAALVSALVGVTYFLYLELRTDHETGEYHFTWGVGVVVLFLLGFAPGLVGLGLYLTIERGYATYWFVALLLGAATVVTALAVGVEVTSSATETALSVAPQTR